MYAPNKTRSDGGIRNLSGMGYRAPTVEIDYVNGGGGFVPQETYGIFPGVVVDDASPMDAEQLPVAPALAFNPPQGQVVVVAQPGQTPRVVVNTPGILIDTSQIGQPPAPSVEGTIADFTAWLQRNTIFAAVPNWVVLAGGVLAFNMLGKGKN